MLPLTNNKNPIDFGAINLAPGAATAAAPIAAPAPVTPATTQNNAVVSAPINTKPPIVPSPTNVAPATGTNPTAVLPAPPGTPTTGPGPGIPDSSFLGLLNGLNSGLQQNNTLVTQKSAVLAAMLGNAPDAATMAALPPDIQNVIKSGDRNAMMLQAQVIDDALQGRNSTVASSIAYLTSGYQTAQTQYNQSLTTILNYAKALNQSPSAVIKAMYPSMLAQIPPEQLAALDKLGTPLLTTTQIPSISTGGGTSGYDLSSYATDPNYSANVGAIAANIGPIESSSDAQSYISANFPQSPITGDMVVNAANQYGVDPTVLMSVLQQESQFASDGSAGATKNNPGNVGNTDSAMAPGGSGSVGYPTLQDGINAAAQTLANDKVASPTENPTVQAYVTGIANGTITSIAQVPAAYKSAVATAMAQQGTQSPLGDSRYTTAANRIVSNFIALPGYSLVANGLPYLQRIAAAEATPGSVSDQDLLDSLTKLNTSGNAISDAQVSLITGGKSFADTVNVAQNKLGTGGVLSDSQRQQISKIANSIYTNYAKGYQPIYDQVTSQLTQAGIPQQFWTIPDLNALAKHSGLTIPGVTDNPLSGASSTAESDPLGLGI